MPYAAVSVETQRWLVDVGPGPRLSPKSGRKSTKTCACWWSYRAPTMQRSGRVLLLPSRFCYSSMAVHPPMLCRVQRVNGGGVILPTRWLVDRHAFINEPCAEPSQSTSPVLLHARACKRLVCWLWCIASLVLQGVRHLASPCCMLGLFRFASFARPPALPSLHVSSPAGQGGAVAVEPDRTVLAITSVPAQWWPRHERIARCIRCDCERGEGGPDGVSPIRIYLRCTSYIHTFGGVTLRANSVGPCTWLVRDASPRQPLRLCGEVYLPQPVF